MSGAEEDFGAFVAARGTTLLRVAYLACGNESDAEELLQTALERTYRNWHKVRHDSPEPYVRRVIVNTAISQARRRAILNIVPTRVLPERPVPSANLELRHELMDALRGLPPRQRAMVVLRYWEDLSEAQAAEVLGCTVGTVKSQTSKAMAKLRVTLGEASLEGVVGSAHA